jgi:hypothetical protein
MVEGPGARIWLAPALVLGLAAMSFALYQTASPAVASVAIVPYAASLLLGPSLVYPWLRGAGASGGRAVAASLLVPALWLLKEGYRVTAVFSIREAVYYAFNPISLGLFAAAAVQMALAELLRRRAHSGRLEWASGPAAVLAAILVLGLVFAVAARGSGGREVFYAYIALYRHLFGDG